MTGGRGAPTAGETEQEAVIPIGFPSELESLISCPHTSRGNKTSV